MPDCHELLTGYPVVTTIPVLWGDQDAFGHVNNLAYLRWAETARVEYLLRVAMFPSLPPSGIAPILGSGIWAATLESARALILTPPEVPPSIRSEHISLGLGGTLNVIPWGIYFLVPSLLMAATSIGLALTVYLRRRRIATAARMAQSDPSAALAVLGHRVPSADNVAAILLAFVLFGVFPVLLGAFNHALELIRALAASSSLTSGEDRRQAWLIAFARTRTAFASRAELAWPGTALATAIAIAMVVRWRRQRPPTTTPPSLSWPFSIFWSMQCLLVAMVCFMIAAPYRAENHLPWPPVQGMFLATEQPNNPPLEGPDGVEPAPVLQLTPTDAHLDGRTVDVAELRRELETAKHNYFLLQPNQPYLGRFIVLCSADTSADRLSSFLLAAYRTGHRSAVFTFTKREDFRRPILGQFHRMASTGATTTLVIDSASQSVRQPSVSVVQARAFPTYGELSRELVILRRAGKEVRVGL